MRKITEQKRARAKFEAEHAAWEAEKQAHEQSQVDVEARHAEALDAARKRVEFWKGMSGVANGESDAGDKSDKAYQSSNPQLNLEPEGFGDFGPIFTQFKGDAKGAVKLLSELQDGEAIGALKHKEIGYIDLVWGKAGTAHSDGFGLAKLVQFHPEVVDHLQEILDDMHVVKRSENRVNLESDTHKAAVRLTWNNKRKKWLLTAFEKKETSESIGKTTDTDDNPLDLRGDNALSQNSDASGRKGNTLSSDKQAVEQKSSGETKLRADEGAVASDLHDDKSDAGIADAEASLAEQRAIAEELKGVWEERTGVKVMLYDRVEDVTDTKTKKALEDGIKVAGWFNAATGEVGVYIPNIKGRRDVERTIIHEVVGHLGIKGLLGEKGYAAFLDSFLMSRGSCAI